MRFCLFFLFPEFLRVYYIALFEKSFIYYVPNFTKRKYWKIVYKIYIYKIWRWKIVRRDSSHLLRKLEDYPKIGMLCIQIIRYWDYVYDNVTRFYDRF